MLSIIRAIGRTDCYLDGCTSDEQVARASKHSQQRKLSEMHVRTNWNQFCAPLKVHADVYGQVRSRERHTLFACSQRYSRRGYRTWSFSSISNALTAFLEAVVLLHTSKLLYTLTLFRNQDALSDSPASCLLCQITCQTVRIQHCTYTHKPHNLKVVFSFLQKHTISDSLISGRTADRRQLKMHLSLLIRPSGKTEAADMLRPFTSLLQNTEI